MYVDEILKNYNKLGTEIIESIYTDGFLSIGGKGSTEILAQKAGIAAKNHILDIGSGVGGPARHLAATFSCLVTGIDLVAENVNDANKRAAADDLDKLVTFEVGDALSLPYKDKTFDIVWGQDAWCHVPDKKKLISQATRVLRTGGAIAFTDWVETGPMEKSVRAELLSAMAAPNLATKENYRDYFSSNDLTIAVDEDVSGLFCSQYREIMAALEHKRAEFTDRYSEKIFEIVAERNACILQGFESGVLGGARFVARKPQAR